MLKIPSFVKNIWRNGFISIIISISTLFILFSTLPLSDLWNTVKKIPFVLWILSVIALLTAHLIGVIKWRLLINTGRNKLSLLSTFRCYFVGLFANIFLPSMIGGDIIRVGLAIRLNIEKEAVIVGSVIDRILDTVSLILIIFCGAVFFSKTLSVVTYKVLYVVFLFLVFLLIFFILFLIIPLPQRMPKIVFDSVNRSRYILKELIKKPWRVLIAMFISIFMQTWLILLVAFLADKLGIRLSLWIWFIIWPVAKLSAMLPISMGGIGVRETALAILLSQFNITITSSVGLGLLWDSLFLVVGGFGGIFYFFAKKSDFDSNTLLPEMENIKEQNR